MKYLSLFSGIGGFELGIQSAFPGAECVGFSEIDKHAIKTYQKHFPEHNCLGSITDINPLTLPDFDMLVGGFPCQDLSIAKANRKGLDGERSGLFWTMLSILHLKQPKYFCFENVASMPKKDRDIISKELGVEPVMINAALVSAQSRKRLFWCNWYVKQPEDREILLRDVLESGGVILDNKHTRPSEQGIRTYAGKSPTLHQSQYKEPLQVAYHSTIPVNVYPIGGADNGNKSYCIDATYYKGGKKGTTNQSSKRLMVMDGVTIRKLTPTECERLQCFPDGWTDGVSNTQRYRQLGNAVNVEVVKHIMNELARSL